MSDEHDSWLNDAFGVDVGLVAQSIKASASPSSSGSAASPKSSDKGAQGAPLSGPLNNPFDAPEAQLAIEKLAVAELQTQAQVQALAAANDFKTAIDIVKSKKKAQADAAKELEELKWTVVITIALLPAGALAAAASARVSGPAMQAKLLEAITSNAGYLQAKFGAKGAKLANKAIQAVASEALIRMAEKFTAKKAEAALNAGVALMKGKTVTFAASTDKFVTTANYLDAMLKAANDSMHNLLDRIRATRTYDEALAYYTLFSKPLQAVYEAMLLQQADDMLTEVAGALTNPPKTDRNIFDPRSDTGDAIYRVKAYGRTLFAHIVVFVTPDQLSDSYKFIKWVTPDMEPLAAKVCRGELSPNEIGGHLPDPQREPGERIVMVEGFGRNRLLLIGIEDQGLFWKDYGVRMFKRWPADEEEEKAFASRGSIQIGGIDKVDLKSIKNVKPPQG
jgi:hypothetical protein